MSAGPSGGADGLSPPGARAEVLARVRAALGERRPAPEVPREYATSGDHRPGSAPVLDLFAERVADYRASVHRVPDGDGEALAEVVLAAAGDGHRLVAAPGVPGAWLDAVRAHLDRLVEWDGGLGSAELDEVDVVLTGCAVAIAATGTVVLDASPICGHRALTLVPDHHLCVVLPDQVVQTVPEALSRLDPTRPLTWVSGPSATSDIELDRVEGVHGPRRLDVILLG